MLFFEIFRNLSQPNLKIDTYREYFYLLFRILLRHKLFCLITFVLMGLVLFRQHEKIEDVIEKRANQCLSQFSMGVTSVGKLKFHDLSNHRYQYKHQ